MLDAASELGKEGTGTSSLLTVLLGFDELRTLWEAKTQESYSERHTGSYPKESVETSFGMKRHDGRESREGWSSEKHNREKHNAPLFSKIDYSPGAAPTPKFMQAARTYPNE